MSAPSPRARWGTQLQWLYGNLGPDRPSLGWPLNLDWCYWQAPSEPGRRSGSLSITGEVASRGR